MKKIKFSKDILIFLLFFGITSFLWVLLALNDEYTAVTEVSLGYKNLPNNLGISSATPESFTLKVSGPTRQLSKSKDFFENTLVLSGENIVNKGDSYFFPPEYLKTIVSKRLAENVKIIRIMPDTLFLNLKNIAFKRVPVKINLETEYAPMYDCFSTPVLYPDSIVVKGATKDIEKIKYVNTQKLSLKNITDTVYRNLELVKIQGVKFSQKQVGIMLPVEKYTEKSFEIEPKILNLPDTINFIGFPKKARISFKVGLKNYNKVSSENFSLIVNFEDLEKDKSAYFTPELIMYPKYVKNINVSPQRFEYFIEKANSANTPTDEK